MACQQLLPRTPLDDKSSVWMIPIEYAVDPNQPTVTGVTVHLISLGLHDLVECIYTDSAQLWAKKAGLTTDPTTVVEGDLVIINAELTPKPIMRPQPDRPVAFYVPKQPAPQQSAHAVPSPFPTLIAAPSFGFSPMTPAVSWVGEAVSPKPEPRSVPNAIKVVMDDMQRWCGVYRVQGVGRPHNDVNKVRLILTSHSIPSNRPLHLTHSGLTADHAIALDDDQFVLKDMRALDRQFMSDSMVRTINELVFEQHRLKDQVNSLQAEVRASKEKRVVGGGGAAGGEGAPLPPGGAAPPRFVFTASPPSPATFG
jgi:hypothetical protein